MSLEPAQRTPMTPETGEPATGQRVLPIWLILLLFILLYWGMVYFDLHGAWFSQEVYAPYRSIAEIEAFQPRLEGADLRRGQVVFESVCGLCHNNDGMGKPSQAPPLAGSEWVLGTPNRLVRIPQLGLTGPIPVKGQSVFFPSGMAAMGATLSDDDLANVLSYMRQAWGNKADAITPEQVKAIRAQIANHSQPTTANELNTVPEK
jgi:mono/diheme cytochrome c family protein